MSTFADLGVSRAVTAALAAEGITEPFPVQSLCIADVLAGRDVLVRSPTGSGKTLAFGIPLCDRIAADARRPAALILAPTRELATQIATELRPIAHARALRVTAVYGGAGIDAQARNAARSQILVATPGRLEDLLARRAFALDAVQVLILDEADRMLDMGFQPAVERIVRACPEDRQTLFFSATLDGAAGTAARRYTDDPVSHEHGPTARRAAEAVEHRFAGVSGDRIDALVDELDVDRELALVFVRTKHGADRLVKRLRARDVEAVAMHGNKTQRQREVALSRFADGAVDVLVATDVAARGIDVAGISHVVNFDPPVDHETYVHRVGRTGRAGARGTAVTLVSSEQRGEIAGLANALGIDHDLGPAGPPAPRPQRQGGQGRPTGQGRSNGQKRPNGQNRPAGESRTHTPSRPAGQGRSGGHARDGATQSPSRSRRSRRRRRPSSAA